MHKSDAPNQLIIKVITKNNKNLCFGLFEGNNICKSKDAHYCGTVKRKQKPTKKREICKYHKKWVFDEKRPFEENKTVMKS